MQEIINKINSLSLESSEEEIYESLCELKSALVHNADVSKSILNNENFIGSLQKYALESDYNKAIINDIIEISLSYLTFQNNSSFAIIEQILNLHAFTGIAIKKLHKDANEISKIIPKSTIILLISCLKSSQVNVGPPTIKLLIEFLSNEKIDDVDIKRELNSLIETPTSSEIKCRIYDVAVQLAVKKYSIFERVRFILDKMISEMQEINTDILMQMNLLAILQNLCVEEYGLNYLEDKGILRDLSRKIETISEDPLISLQIPGLMKFFGNIASTYPDKILRNFPLLVELLFECLLSDDDDLTLVYSALDTLGNLCKHDEGKKSLDSCFGERICQVLNKIYESIGNYQGEVKTRAFQCLENAFYVDDNQEMINNQIAYICQKWCDALFGDANFSSLLNFCNTPFDDLSLCAFGLLKSLVKHQFGQKKFAATGGFIEFLLDRKIGISFEVKQRKFEVVEILSKSNVFNATSIAQLCKYVREGVNFVEPVSEVAFESQN